MSPEQVRGQALDGRSDVFSVGVVLWELITGGRLFAGKTEREEMVLIVQAPIPPPRHPSQQLPEGLSEVILKALERDPKNRIQSAKELARALEQAAGPLLFDTDQRALVMRELFEKKMASTQALLETADPAAAGTDPEEPQLESPAEPPPPAAPAPKVEPTPRAEPVRKAAPAPKKAPPPAAPARGGGAQADEEKPSPATEVEVSLRSPETRVPPATQKDSAPPGEHRTLNAVLWVGVLVCIVLGGGYLVMTLTPTLDAGVTPVPDVQAYQDSRLKSFPESGQPVDAAGLATDGGVPASATAAADSKEKDKDDDKPSKAPRGSQGKMTLIISPEAEVFLGKRSLGKTPLFNTQLPAGTHLLRIVGPDRKQRMLSVPIEAGKTARHRCALKDIPEAR
jgi:serine/threonine-protein kinase